MARSTYVDRRPLHKRFTPAEVAVLRLPGRVMSRTDGHVHFRIRDVATKRTLKVDQAVCGVSLVSLYTDYDTRREWGWRHPWDPNEPLMRGDEGIDKPWCIECVRSARASATYIALRKT